MQDRLRAAVIPRQRDDAGAGEVALEVEDVLDVGAAPLVDGLIGVADHAQVVVIDRQPPGDLVLRGVGVLVLVDEDVAEAGIELGPQLRVVAKGEGRQVEQVVEVHGVDGPQALLVKMVDLGGRLRVEVGGGAFEFRGTQELVLGLADNGSDPFRRETGVVDAGRFDGLLHQLVAVVDVVDGEVAVESEPAGVLAEQARAERVEGADEDAVAGDELLDAGAHLPRRLVGEGDSEDVAGAHALLE